MIMVCECNFLCLCEIFSKQRISARGRGYLLHSAHLSGTLFIFICSALSHLCPTNAKPGSLLQILSMTVLCRKIHPRSSTAAPPSSAVTCLLSNNLFSLCQDLYLSS
ncbi:hypothetical protein CHARACLAT_030074, partial [Characodon lateralis]|nr:hypothetical protein [Characodon lateralis]